MSTTELKNKAQSLPVGGFIEEEVSIYVAKDVAKEVTRTSQKRFEVFKDDENQDIICIYRTA